MEGMTLASCAKPEWASGAMECLWKARHSIVTAVSPLKAVCNSRGLPRKPWLSFRSWGSSELGCQSGML